MVGLQAAARRLGISVEVLVYRLASLGIAIVGRGKQGRITEADIDRLKAPGVIDTPSVPPSVRSVDLGATPHREQMLQDASQQMLQDAKQKRGVAERIRGQLETIALCSLRLRLIKRAETLEDEATALEKAARVAKKPIRSEALVPISVQGA